MPLTNHSLGRIVEHDPRSRNYAFAAAPTPTKTVLWPHIAPILDQGDTLGSCTGNAIAQLLNTVLFAPTRAAHHGGRYLTETDAVALYSAATRLDGCPGQYPPTDTGSSGLAAAKAAKAAGYITAYQHTFTFTALLAALQHQPVIVGTTWTDTMFTPDPTGYVKPTGQPAGGHEYLCLGLNVTSQTLTFLNSWGAGWGRNGRFFMHYKDFQLLLADQGDVTVPLA